MKSQRNKYNKSVNEKNEVVNLIKKYDIKANKKFSQNFLINKLKINKIIAATNATKKNIVEIGPGLGSLTFPLLKIAKSIIAYEIDKKMINVLENEINSSKFKLIKEDFLLANFSWQKPRTLVANIPYNITTKIIFKIIKNTNYFSEVIMMVQKEFGERMIALPKTKHYGKLSASLQSIANVEKIIDVKNTNFIPIPKVDSIVLKIQFKDLYNKKYFDFLVKCFAKQRKTLVNNLKPFFKRILIEKALIKIGSKENTRPQELSHQKLKELWTILENNV